MELFIYDRDFALNDFIGYAKLSLGRGLHSFPFPLNLSLLCPSPLNLS